MCGSEWSLEFAVPTPPSLSDSVTHTRACLGRVGVGGPLTHDKSLSYTVKGHFHAPPPRERAPRLSVRRLPF